MHNTETKLLLKKLAIDNNYFTYKIKVEIRWNGRFNENTFQIYVERWRKIKLLFSSLQACFVSKKTLKEIHALRVHVMSTEPQENQSTNFVKSHIKIIYINKGNQACGRELDVLQSTTQSSLFPHYKTF